MAVEITIPSPGESITEVALGPWQKSSGDWVEKDETLVEIESDKVNLEIPAPESGVLNITEEEGAELNVGDVIGTIDPDGDKPAGKSGGQKKSKATGKDGAGEDEESGKADTATAEKSRGGDDDEQRDDEGEDDGEAAGSDARATSLARKVAAERGINLSDVKGTGPAGRIRKADVLKADDAKSAASENGSVDAQAGKSEKTEASDRSAPLAAAPMPGGARAVRREKMSKLRQRIAQRLVEAQHNAAMLTTFNEADMSEVIALRKQYKEDFQKKHEIGLGFMGFFVKACVSALQAFPRVNAYIVENEIEYHDYVDISIAVGTDKGLVVPVVRNAEQLSFAQIELAIKQLADRARAGKLTIDEMTGGTFTITNGGIFGSLNSTPILNPPQSGILGMHAIKNRPVEDPSNAGQIVVRPMMYLAVSYDHRIIDGAEAVQFLVHIKNMIESPERLLLDV